MAAATRRKPFDEAAGTIIIDTPTRHLSSAGETVSRCATAFTSSRRLRMVSARRRSATRKIAELDTAAPDDRAPARTRRMGRQMPPGLMNPLGARALYMFRNGKDTLLPHPWLA